MPIFITKFFYSDVNNVRYCSLVFFTNTNQFFNICPLSDQLNIFCLLLLFQPTSPDSLAKSTITEN